MRTRTTATLFDIQRVRKLKALACDKGATEAERATAAAMADSISIKYGIRPFDFLYRHSGDGIWDREQAAKKREEEAEKKAKLRALYGDEKPRRTSRTTFAAQNLLKRKPRVADDRGDIVVADHRAKIDDNDNLQLKKFPRFHVLVRTDGVIELSIKLDRERLVALMAAGDSFAGFTYERLLACGTGWVKPKK